MVRKSHLNTCLFACAYFVRMNLHFEETAKADLGILCAEVLLPKAGQFSSVNPIDLHDLHGRRFSGCHNDSCRAS